MCLTIGRWDRLFSFCLFSGRSCISSFIPRLGLSSYHGRLFRSLLSLYCRCFGVLSFYRFDFCLPYFANVHRKAFKYVSDPFIMACFTADIFFIHSTTYGTHLRVFSCFHLNFYMDSVSSV